MRAFLKEAQSMYLTHLIDIINTPDRHHKQYRTQNGQNTLESVKKAPSPSSWFWSATGFVFAMTTTVAVFCAEVRERYGKNFMCLSLSDLFRHPITQQVLPILPYTRARFCPQYNNCTYKFAAVTWPGVNITLRDVNLQSLYYSNPTVNAWGDKWILVHHPKLMKLYPDIE